MVRDHDTTAGTLRFGRFVLDPAARTLLEDGKPVPLGSRAFDLLATLASRAGELVTKREILTRVWPGLVVEENNIQVQVSTLRKLLGARALATIPGRGYRFEATVEPTGGAARTAPAHPPAEARSGSSGNRRAPLRARGTKSKRSARSWTLMPWCRSSAQAASARHAWRRRWPSGRAGRRAPILTASGGSSSPRSRTAVSSRPASRMPSA